MSEILAVAESVWRRILRLKVLYFLVICAIAMIAISCMYKYLMAFEQKMLMVDVSLLLTSIAGLLSVLALAFDIPRELREGAATALLSKPLGRTQYLLGKFVGITIVALAVTAMISIGFCVVHNLAYDAIPMEAVQAHLLTIASVVPMAALALLFASILGEAAAAILTFLSIFIFSSIPPLAAAKIIYGGIIPDFGLFNLRGEASHGLEISWSYVILAAIWGLVYSIALIALTGFIFNRRDLK